MKFHRTDPTNPNRPLLGIWPRFRTSQAWIVGVAFLIRFTWIFLGHTYKFKSNDDHFGFGWEMGRIGASLVAGHGFSNPFGGSTGPTAWEPPLYPYLIYVVFTVFGVYSKASALVLLTFNSLCSALTCIPIYRIARRIFSEKVAVGSAWAWALLPNVIFWCTRWIWETSLSALLLGFIFWLALTLEELEGWSPWAAFGALWSIAALNSTSLLSFLPAAGLWAWYRRAKLGKRSVAGVILASFIFIGAISPWLIRNYQAFGKFIFIRDNFGAELRLGNGPGADGTWMEYLHPSQDTYAMRQYQAMGELPYIAMRKQQAVDYIKADYARFAGLCVKRFVYYWAGPPKATQPPWMNEFKNSLFLASSILTFWGLGRALRMRKKGAGLFFWLILLLPAVYYVVFPAPRYRQPIEPEMTILCVFLITEARGWIKVSPPDQS
ncbi:MAG TPA: glycosyltransferase family 39 protein [Candidatus Eisenbacteria bacterium]|nr:glycosyltransferase family 39 protein [Candidatus Eisenbacteria bacterium]